MGHATFKFLSALIVIVLAFSGSTFAERRYGKPRGFGRQQSGFGNQQNQFDDNQLEYGSLQQQSGFDDDAEGIQQVSIDEGLDEFSGLVQQNNELDDRPPKYTQSTEATTSASPEVVTPKGTFIGIKQTINGINVYAFYGIPFAKPPTGNLRFERPEPIEPFEEPFDATRLPNACPQTVPDIFNDFPGEKIWHPNTNISEDCLYLNIWVPETVFNLKEKELVPVLFWIFGGGFFSGTNSLDVYNGAELAATQSIVVVNVQYRLGPLGFLYLEPGQGNFGLLDQSLGLQWTNQNIEYFGGNPNLVTVSGESCGAASVGFHLVSPKSKGYIKRGILSSGLPNIKYALKPVEEMKANSMQLAKYAGCEQKSVSEIIECLREVDSEKLITLQWKLFQNMLEFPFSPIVDGYFLPDHPDILINKGKAKRADVIMGTVRDEGTYFILYHYLNYFSHLKPTPVPYDRFVEIMNELFYDYSENERAAIIDQYTNWENPEDGYVNQQKIGEAVSDAMFVCPHRKFADTWANRGLSVYYYHFSERFTFNPWGKWMGVMHGDDIPLIFGITALGASATANEKQMVKNFMDMVGKFVKNGVPSPNWERYTSEHPVFLDVNATTVSSVSTPDLHGPNARTCAFWNKLLPLIRESTECNYNNGYYNQNANMPPMHMHQGHLGGPPHWNAPNPYHEGGGPAGCHFNNVNAPQPPYIPHPPHEMPQYHHPMHFQPPPPYQMPPPPKYYQNECAAPTEAPPATSTSCKCTVQEGSTSSSVGENNENDGFLTPPPAIF